MYNGRIVVRAAIFQLNKKHRRSLCGSIQQSRAYVDLQESIHSNEALQSFSGLENHPDAMVAQWELSLASSRPPNIVKMDCAHLHPAKAIITTNLVADAVVNASPDQLCNLGACESVFLQTINKRCELSARFSNDFALFRVIFPSKINAIPEFIFVRSYALGAKVQ
mmetsp:Transcript_49843/g.131141  ORF Transcript_49843/g.131141 Transcript_49843/m.131141 type:complete len:166 (-) Transcript_49843:854-1351(-)